MACSWLRASAGALPRAAAARLPLPPAERWPHAALAHAPVAAVLLRAGGPAGALGWPGAAARRALSGDANKDVREAKAFLLRLRYAPDVADGIIAALKSSGALLPTLYAMAGNWVLLRPPPSNQTTSSQSPRTRAGTAIFSATVSCSAYANGRAAWSGGRG